MTLSPVLFLIILFRQSLALNETSTYVPEGHWRLSVNDETTLRCPYGETACQGGTQAGDFLCSDQFSGLLCAQPVDGYFIDWASQDTFFCDNTVVLSSLAIPVIVILLMLIFICRNVGLRSGVRQLRDLSILRRTASFKSRRASPTSQESAMVPAAQINRHRPHAATHSPPHTSQQSPSAGHATAATASTTAAVANPTSAQSTDRNDGADYLAAGNMDLLHKLKILIFTLQVIFL